MTDIASISTGLKLNRDGIWCGSDTKEVSYPTGGNEACAAIEDESFWFQHRNNCITSLVKAYPPKNGGKIFDVGGGNGYVSLGLINAGFDTVLVEPGHTGCLNAKQRGVDNVICATTDVAGFKRHSLPSVGLFDVIEHIEDDFVFLQSIKALIEKGGVLYATVPAYSFLWSGEDVTADHFRRYTVKSFSRLLASAGFEIKFATYIFRFLPLPILLLRAMPFRLGLSSGKQSTDKRSRDHAAGNSETGRILERLLEPEVRNIQSGKPMRFGGSCLVVAESV